MRCPDTIPDFRLPTPHTPPRVLLALEGSPLTRAAGSAACLQLLRAPIHEPHMSSIPFFDPKTSPKSFLFIITFQTPAVHGSAMPYFSFEILQMV